MAAAAAPTTSPEAARLFASRVAALKRSASTPGADLLQLLCDLPAIIYDVKKDVMKPAQAEFETMLHGFLAQPCGPPIRSLLAESFVAMYSVGETRSLFDTVTKYQGIVSSRSATFHNKLDAMEVLRQLSRKHGRSVMTLYGETVAVLSKFVKSTEFPAKVRVAALNAIGAAVDGTGSAGGSTHAEILKTLRPCLQDTEKETAVRVAACQVVASIACATANYRSIESVIPSIVKALDESDKLVRDAAAEALAALVLQAMEARPEAQKTLPLLGLAKVPIKIPALSLPTLPKMPKLALPSLGLRRARAATPTPDDNGASAPSPTSRDAGNMGEALGILNNAFVKGTRATWAGVALTYRLVLEAMNEMRVEALVPVLVQHILGLLSVPKLAQSPGDAAEARVCVGSILRHGLAGVIGEMGQQAMVSELCNASRAAGSDELVAMTALAEAAYVVGVLGEGAAPALQAVTEAVDAAAGSASSPVRVCAALLLRAIGTALPQNLGTLLGNCLNAANTAFTSLARAQGAEVRQLSAVLEGQAGCVAGLLTAVPSAPLGVDSAILRNAHQLSGQLLTAKAEARQDIAAVISRTRAGWALMSGLTRLGESWVDLWWNDFLGLLGSVLQQDISKIPGKALPLHFMGVTCALQAVEAAGTACGENLGEARLGQLVAALSHPLKLLATAPEKLLDVQPAVMDYVRVGLLNAFFKLPMESYGGAYIDLIKVATSMLTTPSDDVPCSLLRETLCPGDNILGPWPQDETSLDRVAVHAYELAHPEPYTIWASGTTRPAETLAIETQKIDTSIRMFAHLFNTQGPKNTAQVMAHLVASVKSARDKPRSGLLGSSKGETFVEPNVLCALLLTLRNMMTRRDNFVNKPKALQSAQELLQGSLVSDSVLIRRLGAECFGRLAQTASDDFVNGFVRAVMRQLESNQPDDARAGYCLGLACLFRYVESLRTAPFLTGTLQQLLSLAGNPSFSVHLWALQSLWVTVDTTPQDFYASINDTMTIITGLLAAESHASVRVYQILARIINIVMATLGPELQAVDLVRNRCIAVTTHLNSHPNPLVRLEAVANWQQLILMAPNCIDLDSILPMLQGHLRSSRIELRQAAVACLGQLAQRDSTPFDGEGVVPQLFDLLDQNDADAGMCRELRNLVQFLMDAQVPRGQACAWLDTCRAVITGTRGKDKDEGGRREIEGEGGDEGGMLGGAGHDDHEAILAANYHPRWRTRVFAMQCLRRMLGVVATSDKSQLDVVAARATRNNKTLIMRLNDIVTTTFNAATSSIQSLQPEGLAGVQDIIKVFGSIPDPDYEGHFLLEQSQAQLTSAMRAALADETPPSLKVAACGVAVSFLLSTVAQEPADCARIFRYLAPLYDRFETLAFPPYGMAATLQIRVALLSTLATLHTSGKQPVMDLVAPLLPSLRRHWVSLLRDAAIISLPANSTAHAEYNPSLHDATCRTEASACFTSTALVGVPAWVAVMRAASTLLGSVHWTQEQGSKAADDAHLLLGLCMRELTSRTGTAALVAVETLRSLLAPSQLNAGVLGQDVLLELLSSLFTLAHGGAAEVQQLIAELVFHVLRCFKAGYMGSNIPADLERNFAVLCTLFELAVIPVHRYMAQVHNPQATLAPAAQKLLGQAVASLGLVRDTLPESQRLFGPIVFLLVDLISHGPNKLTQQALTSIKYICSGITESHENSEELKVLHAATVEIVAILSGERDTRKHSASAPPDPIPLLAALPDFVLAAAHSPAPKLHAAVEEVLRSALHSAMHAANMGVVSALLSLGQAGAGAPADSCLRNTLLGYLRQMMPDVVALLYHTAQEPAGAEGPVDVADAIKVLLVTFSTAPPEQKSALLKVLVPVFALLLTPNERRPGPTHATALQSITLLGQMAPEDFKAAAQHMPSHAKALLAAALAGGGPVGQSPARGGMAASSSGPKAAPKIQLKAFGKK